MRISTTTLESYRLWIQPDQDWMSEADLVASIKGEFVPTPKVLLGKAFGQVLEDPLRYVVPGGYACNGYTFDNDTMERPLALMERRGVFEAKAVKRYGDCDVVAKADQIIGARLIEHKTSTAYTFDFEKYADSYQWRFMSDIFLPAVITYHVFLLDDHENGVVELRDIHSFNLFPYPELESDCRRLLRGFVGYVEAKGLGDVLRRRQVEAAR